MKELGRNKPLAMAAAKAGMSERTARRWCQQGLLVVDEAQHLSIQALEGLRSLQDGTGTGLPLIGGAVTPNCIRAAWMDLGGEG